MVAKTQSDAGRLPTKHLHGFDSHESMGDLTDDMSRRHSVNSLVFDSFEELRAGRSEGCIRLEMVDEDVGINEDGRAGRHFGKDHTGSCGSRSGLRATKSASS